jgi:hypothetical protein
MSIMYDSDESMDTSRHTRTHQPVYLDPDTDQPIETQTGRQERRIEIERCVLAIVLQTSSL